MSDDSGKSWFARHKILTAIGVVFLIGIFGSALSGDEPTGVASGGSNDSVDLSGDVTSEDAEGGLNQPVRDGKFEFVVTGIDCGLQQVGSASFGVEAQGQFCLLSMRVTNIGNQAQTLFGDNQKLIDAQGREFSANTEAAIYLENSNTFIEEINPGNSLEGVVVFDIPLEAKPVEVELHDSAFSGGVSVRLQ